MRKFSKDFLLGTATAAHQVEGNNVHSDSWVMENMKYTSYEEPSLNAVDHYNLYKQDIAMMAEAGYNAYRFSIEWARIEPEEGVFDEKEIEHYRDVIACCRMYGLEPMVTLHHFSSPKWIITKGGWEADTIVGDFKNYCIYIIERLGNEIKYINTINEANMRLQFARIMQNFTKRMQYQSEQQNQRNSQGQNASENLQIGIDVQAMMKLQETMEKESRQVFQLAEGMKVNNFHSPCTAHGDELIIQAHEAARDAIKERFPDIKVGITLSLHDFQPIPGGEENAAKLWEEEFCHYLPGIKNDDFIGLQNYTRELVGPDGSLPVPAGADVSQSGYEFYPEALEHIIRKVAKDYKGDLYITENGVAGENDQRRVEFIQRAINGVHHCIDDGIPVKGYFYWTFMDNYEWQRAYSMKFGLVAVDRGTQKRTAKPSLTFLGSMLEK